MASPRLASHGRAHPSKSIGRSREEGELSYDRRKLKVQQAGSGKHAPNTDLRVQAMKIFPHVEERCGTESRSRDQHSAVASDRRPLVLTWAVFPLDGADPPLAQRADQDHYLHDLFTARDVAARQTKAS